MNSESKVNSAAVPRIFEPRQLGHANLAVTSMADSLKFYVNICGLEEVFREQQVLAAFVGNGKSHHDIGMIEVGVVRSESEKEYLPDRPQGPELNHLAFELADEAELVRGVSRARDEGVIWRSLIDHGLTHSIYLYAPDDVLVEIYADTSKDWRDFYLRRAGQVVSGPWTPAMTEASPISHVNDDFQLREVEGATVSSAFISRATIGAANMSRSLAFWEHVVGLEAGSSTAEQGWVRLRGSLGNVDVVLFQSETNEEVGLHHLTFQTQQPLQGNVEEQLKRLGIETRWLEVGGEHRLIVSDPDGFRIQFVADANRLEYPVTGPNRDDFLFSLS